MIDRLYRFRILREEPSHLLAAIDEADGAQVWLAPIQFDAARRKAQTKELLAVAETRNAEKFTANGRFYFVASSEAAARDLLTTALACPSLQSANPVAAFLAALKRSEKAGLHLPVLVKVRMKELEEASPKGSRSLPGLFEENSAEILKALIQDADGQSDIKRQNASLQSALKEMAAVAGLEWIEPKVGDPRDEKLHKWIGISHRPGREGGTIATVAIRGLVRRPGTVILKANVSVFIGGIPDIARLLGENVRLHAREFKLLAGVVIAAILVVAFIAMWPSRTATPQLEQNEAFGGHVIQMSDATPYATIYYTTDGSTPTISSMRYSGELLARLAEGTTVRAIAVAPKHSISDVGWRTVYITEAERSFNQGKYFYDRREYARAREPFSQACSGDFVLACNYLGAMYTEGRGVTANNRTAYEYFLKACNQGMDTSCTNLGALYERVGMIPEARKSYQLGCNYGNDRACKALGRLH